MRPAAFLINTPKFYIELISLQIHSENWPAALKELLLIHGINAFYNLNDLIRKEFLEMDKIEFDASTISDGQYIYIYISRLSKFTNLPQLVNHNHWKRSWQLSSSSSSSSSIIILW